MGNQKARRGAGRKGTESSEKKRSPVPSNIRFRLARGAEPFWRVV